MSTSRWKKQHPELRQVRAKRARADMRRFLEEMRALEDPYNDLISPGEWNEKGWYDMVAEGIKRWRAGQDPEFAEWRERYHERGLTDMEFELHYWVYVGGVRCCGLSKDLNEWPAEARKDAHVLAKALALSARVNARGKAMTEEEEAALRKLADGFGLRLQLPIKFVSRPTKKPATPVPTE